MMKLANLIHNRKNKKGFTLVEMIVVIVIIAILAAALVTSLVGYVNKAKDTAAETEAHNVYTAAQACISEAAGTSNWSTGYLSNVAVVTNVNALWTDINEYLGSAIVDSDSDLDIKLNSDFTIIHFVYTATNGQTAEYHADAVAAVGGTNPSPAKPAGWTVS